MKQLYYTACREGQSVHGKSGFGVRAASPGIAADRLQAAVRHGNYELPAGMAPETSPEAAPVRLALLATPDAGRLLCHSAYVGADPTTGRYGNFFSHLLLDVPAELSPDAAIRSWGSRFWHRADNGGGVQLPEPAPDLPPGPTLQDAELARFLAAPRSRELLRWVLLAYLTSRPNQRIILAAPAHDVARCVYGLLRALPPDLTADLTFTTYEKAPLAAPARIIGTWWDTSLTQDLPSSCYSGSALGFNTATGKRTEVAASLPYVEQAVEALAAGKAEKLQGFFATWRQLALSDPGLLDLAYRVHTGDGALSLEDYEQILRQPALTRWLCDLPSGQSRLVEAVGRLLAQKRPVGLVEELLDRHAGTLPVLVDACVAAAVAHGHGDATALVVSHGQVLLGLPERQAATCVAERLLAGPVEGLLGSAPALAFLEQFQEMSGVEALPAAARSRLQALLGLRRFLERPTLEEAALGRVADALRAMAPGTREQEQTCATIRTAVARGLLQASTGEVQRSLEAVLATLGSVLAAGSADLYRRLVEQCGADRQLWRQADLLAAFVAVGFRATRSSELARSLGNLDQVAAALSRQIKGKCGRDVFQAVAQRMAALPDEAACRLWDVTVNVPPPGGWLARLLG